MPIANFLKRAVVAAALSTVVALAGTSTYAYAEELVACDAGGSLGRLPGAGLSVRGPSQVLHVGQGIYPWIGFAPADRGSGSERRLSRTKSRDGKAGHGEAWDDSVMLAALVLMVGDVPVMPAVEGPDPTTGTSTGTGTIAGGAPGGGGTISSGSGSPPATPEPTGLLSGLLGFGLLGAYRMIRRATTPGERGACARA